MKYETTDAFKGDFRRLPEDQRAMFRTVIRDHFAPAADRKADNPAEPWPKALRVRDVEGAPGIWEMTWSFSGPDGRATWEWTRIDDEPAIRWRRIGSHGIFNQP